MSSMPSAGVAFNTTQVGGNAQINNVNGDFHIVHNVYTMTTDQKCRIYDWLAAPDSSRNFIAAREKHHERTGAWFIEGRDYVAWKETPDSVLWVYGTPGCGKTIICSTVIEEIQLRCAENPAYACAYFFFDNRDAQTDQALHEKLIRSIIQQLCDQSDGVPAPLVEIYGSGRQQVSVASLQSALQKIIGGFERTYIIIDALDECTNREKVLVWINELMECQSGKVAILFSSRPEHDITETVRCMSYIARVTLNSKLADNDIVTFLDAMLSKMTRWNRQLIARIRELLITDADGMFRWVALQIEALSKCRTPKALEAQLRTLPKDLDGMYERALLDHPNQVELRQFLMWLAFSIRPLDLEELADVATVDFSSDGLPSYDPNLKYFAPSDMLHACSTFVTALEGTVKLAHMSVKDYLVSDRLKSGAASYFFINAMLAHSLITKTCLAYVFYLRTFSIDKPLLEQFPLANYAAQHWISHMRSGGGEDEHLSQMMDCIFSHGKESALANWVRLDDPDRHFYFDHSKFGKPSSEIAATLYYACIRGLRRMAHQLLIGGAAVNAQGGKYGNALQAASYFGHTAVVRLLLEKGADVNAQGGDYGNALQAASYEGHDATVRLLLEEGADVNLQGGSFGNALQAASWAHEDGVILLLLEKGADVNAQGGEYANALQAASYGGHGDIVRLLLEEGAHVNAQGGEYGNALQAASYQGLDDIVRLLLEEGAHVNAQGGEYGNALQAASYAGLDDIVRLLLEQGADVNAQGGEYGNALYAASLGGHNAIVRLLLEEGADVNAQGGKYGNALQAASYGGHDVIVRLLLEEGADVNAQGGGYGNALHGASLLLDAGAARLLLEKGADVNAQGGYYGTALQAAFAHGRADIVQLLLGQGADVNAKGGYYGSALKAAMKSGYLGGEERHELTVLLLKHGAIEDHEEEEEEESGGGGGEDDESEQPDDEVAGSSDIDSLREMTPSSREQSPP